MNTIKRSISIDTGCILLQSKNIPITDWTNKKEKENRVIIKVIIGSHTKPHSLIHPVILTSQEKEKKKKEEKNCAFLLYFATLMSMLCSEKQNHRII